MTVWAPPRSLAATYGIDVSFSSSPYLDVSVQAVPDVTLWIHVTTPGVFPGRFPHSDTPGSKDICSSPGLFAACRVFHRLLVPRHPPCALYSLTSHKRLAAACTAHSVAPLVIRFLSGFCCFQQFCFGYIWRCNTSDVPNDFPYRYI